MHHGVLYATTLCTVFLPRDARTMLLQDVCPSVCLAHAGILSKRINISSNFFSLLDSDTILVFRTNPYVNIQTETPMGRRLQLGMKNRDFPQTTRFISEMTQGRAIVIMKHQYNSYAISRMVSFRDDNSSYREDKKLSCRREAARCFVSVSDLE